VLAEADEDADLYAWLGEAAGRRRRCGAAPVMRALLLALALFATAPALAGAAASAGSGDGAGLGGGSVRASRPTSPASRPNGTSMPPKRRAHILQRWQRWQRVAAGPAAGAARRPAQFPRAVAATSAKRMRESLRALRACRRRNSSAARCGAA
jgi:hypothetical protein